MRRKIKGHRDLVRDMGTNAVINKNSEALKAYKTQKRKLSSIDDMQNRIGQLEKSILETNLLLRTLLEKL
jgi:hypothetical protein